jgi:hypothetical protein
MQKFVYDVKIGTEITPSLVLEQIPKELASVL